MGFLKKIFGKEETVDKSDGEQYANNHCFLFYGLNEEAFKAIESELQSFDGPDHLNLLRSKDGVLITALCEQGAGSGKVASLVTEQSDLIDYVDQRLDQYIDLIRDNFDAAIGEECVALIQREKPFIVDAIASAMRVWADSSSFENEDFIGAMIAFVKSTKSFDARDSVSDNQNGFNLPLVASEGFIRTSIFACEDIINVKYDMEHIEDNIWQGGEGGNPRNACNYAAPFPSEAPFGFSYFDQDGQLWRISEAEKAVTLASEFEQEFVNPGEEAAELYVSH